MSTLWVFWALMTTQAHFWKHVGGASVQVFTRSPDVTDVYRGDSLDMVWMTSLPDDDIMWCYWKYELGGAWDQFLGYHNTDKKDWIYISPWNKGWSYNDRQSPCQGGIRRLNVTSQYSGNYVMVIGLMNGTEFESEMFPVSVGACRRPIGSNRTIHTYDDRDHVTYSCIFENKTVSSSCNATSGKWKRAPPLCGGPPENKPRIGLIVGLTILLLIICGAVAVVLILKRRNPHRIPSEPLSLEFIHKFPNTNVWENKTLKLTVQLNITKTVTIRWYHDDRELLNDNPYKMIKKKDRYELRIQRATTDMTGRYTCEATAGDNKISNTANITVITSDMYPPRFGEPFLDVLTTTAHAAANRYMIHAEANPAPDVKFFRNGSEFTGSDHISFDVVEGENRSTVSLTLEHCSFEDMCELTMEASNCLGKMSRPIKISIESVPIYKSGLRDVNILAGHDAHFEANFEGFPAPEIEWKHNGIPADRAVVTREVCTFRCTSTFTLTRTEKYHSGNVTVLARNQLGNSWEETSQLIVRPILSPDFLKKMKNRCIKPGRKVTMSVTLRVSPRETIIWTKDDLPIDERDGLSFSSEAVPKEEYTTLESLCLTNAHTSDSGRYRVIAQSEHYVDGLSNEGSLHVTEASEKPRFLKQPQDIMVMKGDPVEVDVEVTGIPVPEIQWEHPKHIECRKRSKDDGKTLIITDAQKQDSDTYKVVAKSDSGKTKCSFSVIVLENPISPKIQTPEDKVGIEDEMVVFSSKIEGFPIPYIQWFLNKKEITKYDGVHVDNKLSLNSVTSYLTLMRCERGDEGTVDIVASNRGGEDLASAKLTVNVVPSFISYPSEETSFMKGTVAILSAEVSGKPCPRITWHMKFLSRLSLQEKVDGNRSELTIRNFNENDAGVCRVEAKNDAGTTSKEFRLLTKEKPLAPNIKRFTDVTVLQGEDAHLTAHISGTPSPTVSWYINELEINVSKQFVLDNKKIPEGTLASLKICGCQPNLSGLVKVVASNSEGRNEVAKKLVVNVKPEFTDTPGDIIKCTKGQVVELTVEVTGTPEPRIKWDLRALSFPSIKYDKNRSTATIKNFNKSDTGEVEVSATNSVGTVSHRFKLELHTLEDH